MDLGAWTCGLSSRYVGNTWQLLGSPWGHLEPSWGHLEAILGGLEGYLGPPWGHLGTSWGHLGATLGELESNSGQKSPCWNAQIAPAGPLCSENACMTTRKCTHATLWNGKRWFHIGFISFFEHWHWHHIFLEMGIVDFTQVLETSLNIGFDVIQIIVIVDVT